MQRAIHELDGHTIVCGYGRMGQTVSELLVAAGRPVVVVEHQEAAFQAACRGGHLAVHGAATEDRILREAGIERASSLVACVDSELENIVITLSARALRSGLTIVARAEHDQEVRKLRRAGANRTVSPFQSGGSEIAQSILNPQVAEFLAHSLGPDGGVALAEVLVEEGSELAGVCLADYGRGAGTRLSFVALHREAKELIIPPRGEECLLPDDRLIVAGDPAQVSEMKARGRTFEA